MITFTVDELLEQQAADLQGLSDERVAATMRLYKETRADLMQRLEILESTGRGEKFTAQHFRNALLQIQDGIAVMQGRMGGQLREGLATAGRMSGTHLAEQVSAGGKEWHGTIRPLPTSAAVAMREGETLMLPRFKTSVDRYGNELISGMQQRMAVSLQSQESLFETRNRIFKDYLQPLGTVKMGREQVPPTAYFAERIVRTEMCMAYNTVFQSHLVQVAEKDPAMRRKWMATGNERMCPTCGKMHDKVVDATEPFKMPDGRAVMIPTEAHPNCKCTAVAWKDVWGEAKATKESRSAAGGGTDGSVPATPHVQPNMEPVGPAVGAALTPQPDAAIKASMAEALRSIDATHGDGTLPPLVVREDEFLVPGVVGRFTSDTKAHVPLGIRILKDQATPALTTVHEVGHLLSYWAIGSPGRIATERQPETHPLVDAWAAAAERSSALRKLRRIYYDKQTKVMIPHERKVGKLTQFDIGRKERARLEYLLGKDEVFARSYAQYVAVRSGSKQLLTELGVALSTPEAVYFPSQWADEDFTPIAEALDALFLGLGWRRPL